MHITLATPVLGQMDPRVALSFARTTAYLTAQGIGWEWSLLMQDAVIAHARNTLVREFLASDSDRLLFIDADLTFTPQDVRALLDADKDFVGAMVSTKGDPPRGAAKIMRSSCTPVDRIWVDQYKNLAMYQASFVGAGFLMLTRKCLADMVNMHPETAYRDAADGPISHALFNTGTAHGQFIGEDLMFCLRWQKIGGRCWVHTGLTIGHVGTRVFQSEELTP